MKTIIRSVSCVIPLSTTEFEKLESLNFLKDVDPRLSAVGAYHIDYDVRYGHGIFFDAKHDTDLTKIEDELKAILEGN